MKKRRRRIDPNTVVLLKQMAIGAFVIFVVVLLLSGIWYGTRLPSLTITSIQAEGGETIDNDEIEVLVRNVLEGEYLGFIPKSFSWFYPKQKIYDVLYSVERLNNVQIERNGPTGLNINFDEYVPHALWCTSVTGDDCLFLDETGYSFAVAPKLTGGSFLRFVESGREPVLDESLLDVDLYEKLHHLSHLLSEQGWFASCIEIDQVGDVFVQIVGGGELKVSTSLTPEETVDNLSVILNSDEFSHIEPGNFKYIDLRFGNKVFVNEELLETEIDTDVITEVEE